jgi:hypothetical protein
VSTPRPPVRVIRGLAGHAPESPVLGSTVTHQRAATCRDTDYRTCGRPPNDPIGRCHRASRITNVLVSAMSLSCPIGRPRSSDTTHFPIFVAFRGECLRADRDVGPEFVLSGQVGDLEPELVGAEYLVTLCDLGIFADQTTEPVPPQDPDIRVRNGRTLTPSGRPLAECPVRAVNVIVLDVLTQDQPQVPLAGDQHPVQALAPGAGNPPLRDRVRPGRPDRRLDDPHNRQQRTPRQRPP